MLIPKNHLDMFLKFLANLGGNVSGPKPTAPEYVVMFGEDVLSIHSQNAVYQVTCTNPQLLSSLQPQWVAVVQALAQPTSKEKSDETN